MESLHTGAQQLIMDAYDQRTTEALCKLTSTFDRATGHELVSTLELLAGDMDNNWAAFFDGSDTTGTPPNRRIPRPPGAAPNLVSNDEDDDVEHPANRHSTGALHIQREIITRIDDQRAAHLLRSLSTQGQASDSRRITDLSHPDTDHTWLWALNQHKGPVLDAVDHVEAVRLRLGIAGPTDPIPCRLCGKDVVSTNGAHALCCSKAEITRGHNRVAKYLHDNAAVCDPNTEMEAIDLIPGTRLRPADVLTGALGNGRTALDVGIASPDATDAGTDCVETMRRRKIEYYRPYTDRLERQNISYCPLVWSAYGRPHAETTTTLRTLSTRIMRRRGGGSSEWRYLRMRSAIGVELMRRAAACVRACWFNDRAARRLCLE